jgi:hypothetical protein
MSPTLILAALLSQSDQSDPASPICAGGETAALVFVWDAREAYGRRSVEIVNAALANDIVALNGLVAPVARFSVGHGDAGYGLRDRGPQAAATFFRTFAPAEYRISTSLVGFYRMNPCGTVTVDLTLAGPERTANLQFKYEGGMLVEVSGGEVIVTEGRFQRVGPSPD